MEKQDMETIKKEAASQHLSDPLAQTYLLATLLHN